MTADLSAKPRRWWLPAVALVAGLAACNGDPTSGDPVCAQETPLDIGVTVSGRLEAADRRFADAYIDYYAVTLPAPTRLTVSQTSSAFDPLILVLDGELNVVGQGFDVDGVPEGQAETASVAVDLGAGCHLIGASAWTTAATGQYILTATTP